LICSKHVLSKLSNSGTSCREIAKQCGRSFRTKSKVNLIRKYRGDRRWRMKLRRKQIDGSLNLMVWKIDCMMWSERRYSLKNSSKC